MILTSRKSWKIKTQFKSTVWSIFCLDQLKIHFHRVNLTLACQVWFSHILHKICTNLIFSPLQFHIKSFLISFELKEKTCYNKKFSKSFFKGKKHFLMSKDNTPGKFIKNSKEKWRGSLTAWKQNQILSQISTNFYKKTMWLKADRSDGKMRN